jgi:hypothetical protein
MVVEPLVDMPSNQNAPSTKGADSDWLMGIFTKSVQSECSSTKGADSHWWNIVSIFVVGIVHSTPVLVVAAHTRANGTRASYW